jgi:hypothetical protein
MTQQTAALFAHRTANGSHAQQACSVAGCPMCHPRPQTWQPFATEPFQGTIRTTCLLNIAGCATPFLGECQTVTLTGEAQAANLASLFAAREIGASS